MQPTFTKKFLRIAIHLCLPVLMALSSHSIAQVFWTEDFGTGCNTGFPADGLGTANGTWTVDTNIGPVANDPFANIWFISAHVNNNGVGLCANDCNGGSNQTLHIGNPAVTLPAAVPADSIGYSNGFFCTTATVCSETHSRAQSPVIDCTSKTNITLNFLYYEGGDVGNVNGDATLWYNDGSTWTLLDPLAKTDNSACAGTIYGTWNAFSISLPASADNNANVRLGFQWDNDNSGGATNNPSTAFDDITLSTSTAPPVPDFTSDSSSICEGSAVNFTDASTGSPTSWSWTFTGGTPSTSTSQNPTGIVYATAGVYDVKLVATNANGSDSTTKAGFITVNVCSGGAPLPDFTANNTVICENDAVDFTDISTGSPTSWVWTFTGGTPSTSTLQSPSGIVYTTAGVYDVKLVATNANGSDSITKTAFITVNVCGSAPVAFFFANDTTICDSDAVDFTDLSTNAPTQWDWTFAGGNPPTSTSQNPTGIVYNAPGIYTVQLVATNATGSNTFARVNYITVANCVPPTANFLALDTSICVGDSVHFTNTSTGNPTTFQWTFFGATPPVSTNPNPTGIIYPTAGVYTVQLIVSNSSGSDTIIRSNYVNVNACLPPIAAFSPSQTILCEGTCIDFSDQSFNEPTSWLWLFQGANVASSQLQNPVGICYNDSGIYNVKLIVTNAYGSDTLVQVGLIEVDTCPKPKASFFTPDTFFCSDNCIDFINTSDNIHGVDTGLATTFHWIFPGGNPATDTTENPHVCYPVEGIYDAILIETNSYGSDTLVMEQYISVINVPNAYIGSDQSILFGASAQLHAGGGVSYLWMWDTLSSPPSPPSVSSIDDKTIPDPIVTPHVSDQVVYYCEITDSTTGCKTTRHVTVEILHNDHIFVPNSFKPTSSGANSTVGVYATNVKSLTFAIYDQWGEKVFESNSTCPDSGPCDTSGWDGKYNGKDCEMGTYVYTVFIITSAGNVYHQNGNITLIR